MKRHANIFFTGSSFEGERVLLHNSSITNTQYQHLIHSALARISHTREGLGIFGGQLLSIADQALAAKQDCTVEQVARLLQHLPVPDQFHNIAQYYQALYLRRRGDIDTARRIFQFVVETAPPPYRARALQCIGAIHHDSGEIDEALRFFVAAGKAALGVDPVRLVQSQQMVAIIRSLHGDHKRALEDLENIFPLVRAVAKQHPTSYLDYLNSLAVELGEVGRIDEAHQALSIVLASPFASVYSNWAETREEIEAKRIAATPSVVAVTRAAESKKPQEVKESKLQAAKALFAIWLAAVLNSPPKIRSAAKSAGRHLLSPFSLGHNGHSIRPRAPPIHI